jgi:radial spoke head protein 9
MELSNISRLGSLNGQTLNVEECTGLEVACAQRRLEENLPGPLTFWGKINGQKQDYLVVFCVDSTTDFPDRKYYYCTPSDYLLRAVPALTSEYETQAATLSQRFTGDPSFFAFNGEEEEAEDPDAPPVERFREVHRLAWTLKTIDHDCSLSPRGLHIVDAGKRVVKNAYYAGLSYQSASEARSYFHLRRPENPQAVATLKKPGIIKSGDFLDQIQKDKPTQMWNIGLSADGTMSHARNLYWEGYSFYTIVGGAECGGAYFGNGVPQGDMAFMF